MVIERSTQPGGKGENMRTIAGAEAPIGKVVELESSVELVVVLSRTGLPVKRAKSSFTQPEPSHREYVEP